MGLSLSKIINTFTQLAPDGKEYLRVANIAPNAYDEESDEFKVRMSKPGAVDLIKSHLQVTNLLTSANVFIGEEIRTSGVQLLAPLDVSKYPKRTLVFYNHHDQPLTFRLPLFFVDAKQSAREVNSGVIDLVIPAFDSGNGVPGRLLVDGTNAPGLNAGLPAMGLDIRRTTAPTTGHLDIYVFGGN